MQGGRRSLLPRAANRAASRTPAQRRRPNRSPTPPARATSPVVRLSGGWGSFGAMDLARELEELLEVETFEPPAAFRAQADWSDPKIYEEAAADPEAWWMQQAKELLDWETPPSKGLNDSNPPFYKWFEDGR